MLKKISDFCMWPQQGVKHHLKFSKCKTEWKLMNFNKYAIKWLFGLGVIYHGDEYGIKGHLEAI
jgi:hypothetical protein